MASKASSSTKTARSQKKPYDRDTKKSSSQPQTTLLTLSPSPSPITTSATPPKNLRDCYLQTCKRRYPNIQPRHDFDIMVLGCGQFKGADSEFYAYSDQNLEMGYIRFTAEQIKDGSARAHIMLDATELLNKEEIPTGMKPCPGEEDVHITPIPNSNYSLRLWGRGLESKREYCLDFIHTTTGQPVNSPFEYELWAVPNKKTPWLPVETTRLYSLEHSFGIAREDILEGEERFVMLEGTACVLKRKGMRSVYFEVPVRQRRDVDFGDFDELVF